MWLCVFVHACMCANSRHDLIYTENTKAKHSKNHPSASGAGKGNSPEAKPDSTFGSITEGIE